MSKPKKGATTEAPVMTVKEFCQRAGVSFDTYKRREAEGLMPRFQPGGILRAKAQAYLSVRAKEAAAAAQLALSPKELERLRVEGLKRIRESCAAGGAASNAHPSTASNDAGAEG